MSKSPNSDYDLLREEIFSRINRSLNQLSIFKDAPDLLSEAILELAKILTNYKAKNGENQTYKKFKEIEKAMLHSFNFINDISKIHEQYNFLKVENQTLKKLLSDSNNELSAYKIIESEILKSTLEVKYETVTAKIKRDLYE